MESMPHDALLSGRGCVQTGGTESALFSQKCGSFAAGELPFVLRRMT